MGTIYSEMTNKGRCSTKYVRKEQCHRYCELLRYRADKDPNKRNYISMTRPDDPTKCTLFWSEKGGVE